MTQVVAWAALLVSVIGAWYTWRSVKAAERAAEASVRSARASEESARAAIADDHRAPTPELDVTLERPARWANDSDVAIYSVRNQGHEHLDSVIVHKPEVDDQVRYPVAATGRSDWSDQAEIGPLPVAGKAQFTLSVGP